MKKPIKAKRVAAAVFIITIVLVTFPLSSFGWDGCVIRNAGDILGLVFDFGADGLPMELPGLGSVDVTFAEVQGSGFPSCLMIRQSFFYPVISCYQFRVFSSGLLPIG